MLIACLFLTRAEADSLQAACSGSDSPDRTIESNVLRVVTLNMAHGRKDGKNQMFLKDEVIRDNLVEVSQGMAESGAHVVGLQEADAASSWSGNFDHVAFLSEQSGFPCYFHGIHATNRYYDFGTALLSKYAFEGAFSYSFKPSWPTTTKGFVVAAVDWNPGRELEQSLAVKIASIHLDFSRRSVRRAQIDEMVKVLSKIEGPLVLMGDFNTDWKSDDSSLKYLAESLNMSVYSPHAEGLSTYGDKGARLDWILISSDLEFLSYAVVPKVMSDHYAVAAEIALRSEKVAVSFETVDDNQGVLEEVKP